MSATQQPMTAPMAHTNSFEMLFRLCELANGDTRRELLPLVGCRVLCDSPLFPDIKADSDGDLSGELQADWIDDQLYRCLPQQAELESLGDAQFAAMQSGWPEGFQLVVFDDGARDEFHARELIEPFLEWAERFTLPIMTDFDATQKEMEQHLTDEFVQMIREWRQRVLTQLGKRHHP